MYVCRLGRYVCLERWRENQSFDVLFPFPNTIRSSFSAMNECTSSYLLPVLVCTYPFVRAVDFHEM